MCTIIIYRNHTATYPVIIAQIRDEKTYRKWLSPARHWPDKNNIIAGIDLVNGGSWLGINDTGIFCSIVNGANTLTENYDTGMSRGHIVTNILAHKNIASIRSFLQQNTSQLSQHKDFTLVVVSSKIAFCCINQNHKLSFEDIPLGISMITRYGLNNQKCHRVNKFTPKLKEVVSLVKPELDDWTAIIDILAEKGIQGNIYDGLCVEINDEQFGTLSSSIIALQADHHRNIFKFCDGYPRNGRYQHISL